MEQGTGVVGRLVDRFARSDTSAWFHARVLRASGGRVATEVQGKPVLLLATTGRRTGQRREVALMYLEDGGRYLVVPANAARPDEPPLWWRNLQADPTAEVLVGGTWRPVRGDALDDDERDRVWPRMTAHNPNWGRFQAETARRFPVVALDPAS